jgi:hypothetical protein
MESAHETAFFEDRPAPGTDCRSGARHHEG